MPSLMKSVSMLTREFLKLVPKGWFFMQTHSVVIYLQRKRRSLIYNVDPTIFIGLLCVGYFVL